MGFSNDTEFWQRWTWWGAVLGGVLVLTVALSAAIPAATRYQERANAENQVQVNNTKIQQTKQLVEVEQQRAAIRVAEAEGISQAQHIINATLTDRYLQHEAIQAQAQMAGSPNHTQIYIPVGTNGIPLVHTTNAEANEGVR